MSAAVAEMPGEVAESKSRRVRPERPALTERRYTIEQFERLSGTKGYELVDGIAVRKPMGSEADYVAGTLHTMLRLFANQHRLGFVFGAEGGYVLDLGDRRQLRKPDCSFVVHGRFLNDRPTRHGYPRFAPDFAFESVSPRDKADKLQVKVEEYLKAGVRLVWVAYPEAQVVLAYRPDGSVRRHVGTDPLTAEDLFPGFSCTPADLFAVG